MNGSFKSRLADYQSLLDADNDPSNNVIGGKGAVASKKMLSEHVEMKPPVWQRQIDRGAFHFALRMAVLLTIGSLFVLIRAPGDEGGSGKGYPQGMWVLVTLLFVCWFPSLDAASVIEKSVQRLIGTFIGASIGFLCGFTSLAIKNEALQVLFLASCVFVVVFLVIFLSGNFRIGRGKKIMQRFNYATILCLLTFSIAVLPFHSDEEPKWRKGVWRVLNVILGCILGAIGCVLLFPRSTTSILRDKVDRQVRLAGESSQAVLHAAADAFSGHLNPLALADELLETPTHRRDRHRMSQCRQSFRNVNKSVVDEDGDRPLTMYVDAINDWKSAKILYPVMPYDPFSWFRTHVSIEETEEFQLKTARILAQALRIQTMIVCLDGIIRNDMPGYDFDDDQVEFFAEVGTSIRNMLTLPFDETKSGSAAMMVDDKLTEIRQHIKEISSTMSGEAENVESATTVHSLYTPVFESIVMKTSEDDKGNKDPMGGECKAVFPCTASCVLLFLQLVEQLMLRSLRLYHTWTNAAEQMENFAPRSPENV
mmetsp:Transcript_48503/g.146314  ORF Transcript_48503/g.146314 Transcript_48503/m.146314 type:complete len:538 (-) Transcript_48503:276-1889(-)|eukprot:CAMPEP_0113546008 /NCGR_PEP_ID=MMETSP0015_2-20120614/11574_1 /TAXON_ID=2838 /ORGANISM="Odontella" /LENGTH=537 /DNA_ID=CAMNT_0000446429 /DNA_START=195 /DNA_END=1808 /DNA_ORIENTATION=+ /assembly_acc=CAM_ASM_000160